MPPPIPVREDESCGLPPVPVRSPKRRPIGAVATVMLSGQGPALPPSSLRRPSEEEVDHDADGNSHANNPYDLKAAPGAVVTASYPFHGDEDLQQLSFSVSLNNDIVLMSNATLWPVFALSARPWDVFGVEQCCPLHLLPTTRALFITHGSLFGARTTPNSHFEPKLRVPLTPNNNIVFVKFLDGRRVQQ